MWQKYYQIAERQYIAGKSKTVEGHALKALKYAQEGSDAKQIAQSLSLLARIYSESNNPLLGETLRQSVEMAERAFGPESIELADELEALFDWLEDQEQFDGAETALIRALKIVESCCSKFSDKLLYLLDYLLEFYIRQQKFVQAEAIFLRALEIRKSTLGADSEEVEEEIERYVEILEGLGRHEEVSELENLLHHCPTCGPESGHIDYAPEVAAIVSSLAKIMADLNLDRTIDAFRDAIPNFKTIVENQAALIADHYPFRELKLRVQSDPCRWAQSQLAQLLRTKFNEEKNRELLIEACDLLRTVLAESEQLSDKLHLLLTLFDLYVNSKANEPMQLELIYSELERLISELPVCAAGLYTKALMMFVRFGSTPDSRSAMRAALNFNLFVPEALATPLDPAQVPNHFNSGTREEAQGYCFEAAKQWIEIPDALDFMIDVMNRSLPRSIRQSGMRMAQEYLMEV